MRTRITQETLYSFDELSDSAKAKALSALWDMNVTDNFWYEYLTEDIAQFGSVSGLNCAYGNQFDIGRGSYISIDNVSCYLSALYANFDKALSAYPDVTHEVIQPFLASFTPREIRHLITLEQRGYLGELSGHTSTERHGIRANVEADVWKHTHCQALVDKVEKCWTALLQDLEHFYVTSLRHQYEYETSEETIVESIRANEYEFLADGTLTFTRRES